MQMDLYCPEYTGEHDQLVFKQSLYIKKGKMPQFGCEWKPKVIDVYKVGSFNAEHFTILYFLQKKFGADMRFYAQEHDIKMIRYESLQGCSETWFIHSKAHILCDYVKDMHQYRVCKKA